MLNVTAATSFFGTEGMWRAGDTKRVSAHRAHELIEEGLAIESSDQSEPQPAPLAQVADALGATATAPADQHLPAVADALGAKVATAELPAVTLDSLKENKDKRRTKEEKSATERETKEAE